MVIAYSGPHIMVTKDYSARPFKISAILGTIILANSEIVPRFLRIEAVTSYGNLTCAFWSCWELGGSGSGRINSRCLTSTMYHPS